MILFIFICVFTSLYFAYSAYHGKNEGRMIPGAFISYGGILYLTGLLGMLSIGVIICLAMTVLCYGYAAFCVLKNGDAISRLRSVVSVEIIIFFVLSVLLYFMNHGMVISGNDEFSHWGDVVKAMVQIDDFSTSSLSHSLFQAYPPGMSLLQYFIEKINGSFDESLLYFVYQMFIMSMFIPFAKYGKSMAGKIILMASACFLPLIFYEGLFSVIYIDPVVGILAGCGLASVLLHEEDDTAIYDIYIIMISGYLVLLKDVGLFFSLMVGIAFLLEKIRNSKFNWYASFPVIAAIISKASWKYKIRIDKAVVDFGNRIFLKYYLKLLFLHPEESYRQEAVDKCRMAVFDRGVVLSGLGIKVSYFVLFVILFLLMVFVISRQKENEKFDICGYIMFLGIPFGQAVLYLLFIGAMYAFRFTEYEAVNLASYERYVNMTFLCLSIVVFFCLIRVLEFFDDKRHFGCLVLTFSVILIISNLSSFMSVCFGDARREAVSIRARYAELSEKLNKYCDEGDKVYPLCMTNYDWLAIKYLSRPNEAVRVGWGGTRLGKPAEEEDIYYYDISAEDWMDFLVDNNVDYVAIYDYDDYFADEFRACFENCREIGGNRLYKVDAGRRCLRLMQ